MRAFTVLEMLIVLVILGFFAAMVAPLVVGVSRTEQVQATQARLASLRTSVLGGEEIPQATPSSKGAAAGYVAHHSGLPRLYWGAGAEDTRRWAYTDDRVSDPDTGRAITDAVGTGYAGAPDAFAARWESFTHVASLASVAPEPITTEDEFELALLRLHPLGLFERRILSAALRDLWQGPYAQTPVDAHPDDGDILDYTSGDLVRRARFLQTQTEARFADAWGRSLLFFPYYAPAAGSVPEQRELWIVSEGPDGRSAWNLADPSGYVHYDPTSDENLDNVVLKIAHNEWRDIVTSLESATRDRLEAVRAGLLGAPGRRDRLGRPVVGGFLGDLGRLPHVYESLGAAWSLRYRWDAAAGVWRPEQWTGGAWTGTGATFDPEAVSPRGLWRRDPVTDADPDNDLMPLRYGVGWRGAYVPAPRNETQRLADAWGRPLYFYRDAAGLLYVLSAGPDGQALLPAASNIPGTYDPSAAENLDNLAVCVADSEWRVPGDAAPAIAFEVRGGDLADTRARLYMDAALEAETPARFDELGAWTEDGLGTAWRAAFANTVLDDFAAPAVLTGLWQVRDAGAPPGTLNVEEKTEAPFTDGGLVLTGTSAWGANGVRARRAVTRRTGRRVQARVHTPATPQDFMFGLYAVDGDLDETHDQLAVWFHDGGTVRIWDGSAPADLLTGGGGPVDYDPDTEYSVAVEYATTGFRVLLDGTEIYPAFSDGGVPADQAGPVGYVSADAYGAGPWRVDDVTVDGEVVDDFNDNSLGYALWRVYSGGARVVPNVRAEAGALLVSGTGVWEANQALSRVPVRRVAGKRVQWTVIAPDATHSLLVGLTPDAASPASASEGGQLSVMFDSTGAISRYEGGAPVNDLGRTYAAGEAHTVAVEFASDAARAANDDYGYRVLVDGEAVYSGGTQDEDRYWVVVDARSGENWQVRTVSALGSYTVPAGPRAVLLWDDADGDGDLDAGEPRLVREVMVDASGQADRTVRVSVPW